MGTFVSLYSSGSAGFALSILQWSWSSQFLLQTGGPWWLGALVLALVLGFVTQGAALIYAGASIFGLKTIGGVVGVGFA
jgi:hypothetical protein